MVKRWWGESSRNRRKKQTNGTLHRSRRECSEKNNRKKHKHRQFERKRVLCISLLMSVALHLACRKNTPTKQQRAPAANGDEKQPLHRDAGEIESLKYILTPRRYEVCVRARARVDWSIRCSICMYPEPSIQGSSCHGARCRWWLFFFGLVRCWYGKLIAKKMARMHKEQFV